MKKKILALVLAAVMVVGLAPVASAANFSDVIGRWSQDYIADMTELGLYKGYDDGLFHPTDPLTTAQAISICVRMCAFDEKIYDAAAKELEAEVYFAVNGKQNWFHRDFAVAVKAGIVTIDELRSLEQRGKLAGALTREEFSEYLVRAMQLTLPQVAPELDFVDAAEIADAYRAPVYMLSTMGIVVGSLDNGLIKFNPKNTIKREDSATMFSRAVKYIKDHSMIIEIYDYTTYGVQSGRIVSFENSVLTIEGGITGRTAVELPRTAEVYEQNVLSGRDSIEAGRWAVVCSNAAGVFAVRVYDGNELEYAGELREFDGSSVTFNTGTRNVTLPIDRETVFMVGDITGGAELYDKDAGYEAVNATVDPTGRLTALRFEGGSRAESLFLRSANDDGTYTVAAHSGAERSVKLAKDAKLELLGSSKTLGASANVGKRMDVRVDNTTGELIEVTMDGTGKFAQGGFVRTYIRTNSRTITIEDTRTGSTSGHKLAADAKVSYEGKEIKIGELSDMKDKEEMFLFVTLTFDGDTVVKIEAYPGSSEFEGTLVGISYGKTISFSVENHLGETREYSFATGDMPQIKRGNRVITADKLREGDTLKIFEKYSKIESIAASVAEADFNAVVEGISITAQGTKLSLTMEETGKKEEYILSTNAEILNDGKPVAVSSLTGMRIAATISSDEIVRINVLGADTQAGQILGCTVLFVNSVERTLMVELSDGRTMTISVPYSTGVMSINGSSSSLSEIKEEDVLDIYGEIGADGSFTAKIIIKK